VTKLRPCQPERPRPRKRLGFFVWRGSGPAQVKEEILKRKGRENLKTPTGGRNKLTLSTIDKVIQPHNSQKEIAKELGWSTGKVAQGIKEYLCQLLTTI